MPILLTGLLTTIPDTLRPERNEEPGEQEEVAHWTAVGNPDPATDGGCSGRRQPCLISYLVPRCRVPLSSRMAWRSSARQPWTVMPDRVMFLSSADETLEPGVGDD